MEVPAFPCGRLTGELGGLLAGATGPIRVPVPALLIDHPNREVVLCADACYLKRNLDELALPGVVFDRERMMKSLKRLAALRDAGCSMIYGHDPEAWASVPQSPAELGEAPRRDP